MGILIASTKPQKPIMMVDIRMMYIVDLEMDFFTYIWSYTNSSH